MVTDMVKYLNRATADPVGGPRTTQKFGDGPSLPYIRFYRRKKTNRDSNGARMQNATWMETEAPRAYSLDQLLVFRFAVNSPRPSAFASQIATVPVARRRQSRSCPLALVP